MNLQPFLRPLEPYLELSKPEGLFGYVDIVFKGTNISALSAVIGNSSLDGISNEALEIVKKIQSQIIVKRVDCDWGCIVPQQTGIVWVQQTSGVMCEQTYLEGTLIPFPTIDGQMKYHQCWFGCEKKQYALEQLQQKYPDSFDNPDDMKHDLSTLLHQHAVAMDVYDNPEFSYHDDESHNRNNEYIMQHCIVCNPQKFNPKPDDIMNDVKMLSGFDWIAAEIPADYPFSTEAFEWVRFTKVPKKTEYGDPNYDGLLGKTVVLVYPNSD